MPSAARFRWIAILWTTLGVAIALLWASQSATRGVPASVGIAAWCAVMMLVLLFSAHPIGAPMGSFVAGVSLAIPCLVASTPLARLALVCIWGVPIVACVSLAPASAIGGLWARLAYLGTWCATREVAARPRSFDAVAAMRFLGASAILSAMIVLLPRTSDAGFWLWPRWFVGAIGILAMAEVVTAGQEFFNAALGVVGPLIFRSPHRSSSIQEFWSARWNPAASELFRQMIFRPLARRNVAAAVVATFGASGLAHGLLAFFALGSLWPAWACGAFFLVQPIYLTVERRLAVRRWSRPAGRVWTTVSLMAASPLLVEPVLQIVQRSWGESNRALPPLAAAIGCALSASGLAALTSLVAVIQRQAAADREADAAASRNTTELAELV